MELASGETAETPDVSGQPEPDQPEEDALPEEEAPEEELPGGTLPEEDASESTEETDPAVAAFMAKLGKVFAVIGAAVCTGVTAYALALLLRRRERTSPEANRSAICAYRRYERVLRLGGTKDETLEELGRKARFSQHTLTEEERETAWRCLEEAAEAARKRQKKPMRWLLYLLRPLL